MAAPTPQLRPPDPVPGHTDPEGNGVVVGDGPVVVDTYIDFLCPFCRRFAEESGPTLDRLVDDRTIRVVHHPLGFLDDLSPNRYSSRAAAASGCAADGNRFREYFEVLFAHQPAEGEPGHTDEELAELGRRAGLTGREFAQKVLAGTYLDWTAYVTSSALARGVGGTPTVTVQGTAVPAEPRAVLAAVGRAATRR
ncbi:DsbA family protein [Streptomyces minutiscleroticus]|uniref:Thioredoxin-like fold domain-containing protein n=1 Tax=Streptomyces minutiscleroticus TaxID=68238 RepID=A0A918P0F3_9ACTN|nr:thioredoxin domain-containing protein [Streptomyces minutiscleroticus]GGY11255.1 hypothetical protein GCM10010358_74630 [Streptomyces minutiscleroticus]